MELKRMKMTVGFSGGNNATAPNKKSKVKKGIVQSTSQVNIGYKPKAPSSKGKKGKIK